MDWMHYTPATILSSEAKKGREKADRIARIIAKMREAPAGTPLLGWAAMSEDAIQRRYAEAIEPLLKEAERDSVSQQ